MSLADVFRRMFSPSSDGESAEDAAVLHEEYGSDNSSEAPGSVAAGGVSGLAGLEDAEAAEGELEQFEPPGDPAP